jgi:tetratricopeptide (TPR) repeat protein
MTASPPVLVRRKPVVIPTYPVQPPDKNPMFLEKRVYQGSSGKVYPLPFYDRVGETKVDQAWDAVHIENEYLYVMVLPQLGGRIHIGRDKTNGYDFFYRQSVIKPALVGLAGPWISGGVEFNWPQHHRPSTFMPVDVHIEEHADGSKTVWCSEHEPMNRMKGMHGVCLHPGKAYIELKVRLYNRTPLVQTFLWWANVAARVHDRYQSFFPPDVHYVADHAKRAMSEFPICRGFYYGVDYRPGTDLSWYKNIPVPTSYMAMGSQQDFFGGYDHAKQAGFVHIANHHISPGKKQWTWGNHEFGYAWNRNLTDSDGPYIELMAGVYTDNQPDFSFLMPGETKTFSQFWYPIQQIGPVSHANLDAAISERGVCVTSEFPGATVDGRKVDLAPGKPFLGKCRIVTAADGREIIRYEPKPRKKGKVPPPATEPALPADIASNDQLYLTGLHLEQYRHATRSPEPYWREALRRDPGDSRCHNALGLWHLRRGEFEKAEQHFRRAIERLTERNPNPYDGEPYYNLGLALRYLGRDDDAYAAFYKATWNYAWQSAGYHALAEIDCCRHDWTTALEHLDRSLRVNADNLRARDLKAIVMRKLGHDADAWLRETLALDPLDWWARHLLGEKITGDDQTRLDIALDCARAGVPFSHDYVPSDACFPSRLEEIALLESRGDAQSLYYLGCLLYDKRRHEDAIRQWEKSAKLDPKFPTVWRNLGIAYFNVRKQPGKARAAYEQAFRANPQDARVFYERDQLWKRLGVLPAKRLKELERHLDLVRQRDDLSIELCALYNQTGQPEKALAILTSRKFQPWEGGEGQALGQWVRAQIALRNFEAALNPPANLGEARHLLANASDVWYRLGCATGDRQWWKKAAEFRGDFQEMSVRSFSEMTYYAALSLEQLGRQAAARKLLRELLAYAKKLYRTKARMDYFATSLPTMLLFEDDLQKRQRTTALLLMAQAQLGLGKRREARKRLARVLKADPSHALAADLLKETGGKL